MPKSREIPEGAPSDLFNYLRAHQGSTVGEAMAALCMRESTTYNALAALHDLGRVRRWARWFPPKWYAIEDSILPPPIAPAETRLLLEASMQPIYAYTGTLVKFAGAVSNILIRGAPQKREDSAA